MYLGASVGLNEIPSVAESITLDYTHKARTLRKLTRKEVRGESCNNKRLQTKIQSQFKRDHSRDLLRVHHHSESLVFLKAFHFR